MYNSNMVFPLAVTGGPCAGKTSILSFLNRELTDRGYKVLIVPESATVSFSTGVHPSLYGLEFQKLVLSTMLHLEDQLYCIANRSGEKTVILCDRGIMDMLAYIELDTAKQLTKELQINLSEYRDRFYKAVIHLQTAAYGAESFYTLENNTARTETIEQARILDDRVKKAWVGHPKLITITNDNQSFEEKKLKTLQAICGVLGIPEPVENELKFRINPFIRPSDISEHYVSVEIIQDYLKNDTATFSERVRKRGSRGAWVFSHTIKKPISGSNAEIENERIISKEEYRQLLKRRDTTMSTITKDRYCFLYENQYFEMDFFKNLESKLVLLELELTKKNHEVVLPFFLKGNAIDVTGLKEFKNQWIAQNGFKEESF